jgi:hypothetical protein
MVESLMNRLLWLAILLGGLLFSVGAFAQNQIIICVPQPNGSCIPVTTVNPLPTSSSGGSGGGVVKQGAQDATAVPWQFDTTGTGNLDTEVKGPISTGGNTIGAVLAMGSAAIATGQSAAFTTAIQIVAARTGVPGTGRRSVTIANLGTVDTFCGVSGVTTATGMLLVGIKGAAITLDTTAAVYCAAAASSTVSYVETF